MVLSLMPQHQILICGTYTLPELRRFWTTFWTEFANERLYKASIGNMRLRLQKLKEANSEVQELRQQKTNGYKEIDEIFHHQGLLFISKVIWTELIRCHHDNSLAGHFGIEKTCKFLAQKYYWPIFRNDVEAYVKGCDVYLASKAVCYKPYNNLQSLPVPTHQWKDFLMDFVTGLPILINWKGDSYDSILVIVDWLINIVHYKPVKITIDAPGLAKVIIDVLMRYHGLLNLIVTNQGSLFTSKFWSLLCYFLGIKCQLSTAFHPQTDFQTKR